MSDEDSNPSPTQEDPTGQCDEALAAKTAARAAIIEAAEAGDAEALKKLTKEEQMALYEKALKEDDWGHQPC